MTTNSSQPYLTRAADVVLRGPMRDASFEEQQWLVQRGTQFVQLTALLYRILEHSDGCHTATEIAEAVTASSEWLVTADVVESLAATRLVPTRLAAWNAGGDAASETVDVAPADIGRSALDVRMRAKIISPTLIDPVTSVLQHLFRPVLLVPILLIAAAMHA